VLIRCKKVRGLKLKQKQEKLEYIISVVIFSMILIGLESLMMIIGGGKL